LVNDAAAELDDAAVIEGFAAGDQLFGARGIGDINGDGIEDVVLESARGSRIVMGPFDPSGLSRIDEIANVELGDRNVIPGSGDNLGSAADELVVQETSTLADGRLRTLTQTHLGGVAFDRDFTNVPFETSGSTVDGTPVPVSFVDWTGPDSAELHFPLPQPLASGQIGSVKTDAGIVRLFFDPTLVPVPTGTTLNADARYSTTPVGDINGDGKEELALSSPNMFLSSVQGIADIGMTFIVLGGQSGDIQIHSQAHAVIQGSALSEVVSALGDINQDGHDDFAISRSLESNGSLDGGLLIYFGQQTYRTDPNVMAMLGSNDASLTFARSTAGQLAGASAVRGPLTAAAGDLNGDGRVDLVVGAPGEEVVSLLSDAVLQSNYRGQASIYLDVMSHGERLIDDAAGRILRGTSATVRAGSITPGNLRDLNGDSIDDLVIGASTADGLIGGLRADTGRIYFVPGVRQRVELPSGDCEPR
jgi:hypothetical protein